MDTLWKLSLKLKNHFMEFHGVIPCGTSKGLFTRREGYPRVRVTLASGLKLALVYKQISKVGLPYHPGQLYQLC